MKTPPPDKNRQPPAESPPESVQQYLDLLLSSATEKAEAQIDDGEIPVRELTARPVNDELKSDERAESALRPPRSASKVAALETKVDALGVDLTERSGSRLDSEPVRVAPSRHRRKSDIDSPLPRYKEAEHPVFQIPMPSRQPAAPVLPVVEPRLARESEPTPVVPGAERRLASKSESVAVVENIEAAEQQQVVRRPEWANHRFECLLFTVGGLTLAVPLTELGAIYHLTEEMTPIFGQVDWFLGILPVKERNIRVVNTAKVVMPERYCEAMIEKFDYIISLNGVDWALAVDGVSESISLEPDNIRWSSKSGKRPWLAGTVIEHMCALLDVSQLAAMFAERESGSTNNMTR